MNWTTGTPSEDGPAGEKVGIDELTGLWNRAGFVAAATPLIASCRRREAPVLLGYFDIGTYGTNRFAPGGATPDHVLNAMGDQMRKTFRDCDIVGRIDTWRFAVLFADCTDEALAAIEGVRAVTDEAPQGGNTLTVAIVQSAPGSTLEQLMREAHARTEAIKREQARIERASRTSTATVRPS